MSSKAGKKKKVLFCNSLLCLVYGDVVCGIFSFQYAFFCASLFIQEYACLLVGSSLFTCSGNCVCFVPQCNFSAVAICSSSGLCVETNVAVSQASLFY